MQLDGLIYRAPKEIKVLIGAFIFVLSVGFYTGLLFVKETSSANPNGIEEQYLGNENQEHIQVMKFKKSDREMLTMIHGHILSMSIIFFLVGLIVSITRLPSKLKLFLLIEPFVSVVLTFGGIYLLWKGILWMKYVIMFSGTLMSLTYTISAVLIIKQLFKKPSNNV